MALIATLLLSYKLPSDAFLIPTKHSSSLPTTSESITSKSRFPTIVSNPAKSHELYPSQHSLPFVTSTTSNKKSTTELHGIPKMFRWLTDQYPNINSRLSEGLSSEKVVDNFYLDMNGIIHPCTHGNNSDEIIVLDETAMFKKIFGYVDR